MPSGTNGNTDLTAPEIVLVGQPESVAIELLDIRSAPLSLPDSEPSLVGCTVAQLPALSGGLRLRHGPLLITLEHWSDGSVIAKLPSARLYAEGTTQADALYALAEEIEATVRDLTVGPHGAERLGGAMLDTWRALSTLIDAPGLDGRPRE